MDPWHALSVEASLRRLGADPADGLSDAEASGRLSEHGPNELKETGIKSPVLILWEQFTAVMVLILIAAAVVSGFIGKTVEMVAILAIVVMFAMLGFVQEYRAERAIASLKKLAVPLVRVRRNGVLREMSARELVPGDVLSLEAGNTVPADIRLVDAVNLRIQESALTGESEPVEKITDAIPEADLPLGDRRNMAYMGTNVTMGRGSGLVVQTGMQTELGTIATLIQGVASEPTPLQTRLDRVGKTLAVAGIVAAVLIGGIGIINGESFVNMLIMGVSIAVAVIPEGLPAVVTITLALGAQRMLKRRALIRKLPAVETLGSVTVICSDKTGTLTENRMTVTFIDVAGYSLDLNESMRGRSPALNPGDIRWDLVENQPRPIWLALMAGALCNDAVLKPDAGQGRYHTLGDPTEGALVVAAAQMGMVKEHMETFLPRIAELPFDSNRKRMTTLHRLPSEEEPPGYLLPVMKPGATHVAFTKGSLDGLLEVSSRVLSENLEALPVDELKDRIIAANDSLAAQGMRVLGVALQWLYPGDDPSQIREEDLAFIGMVGMIDPPRPEVREAVQVCRNAGIRPVMITGDHPLTASAIARDLRIAGEGARTLAGQELNRLGQDDLENLVEEVSIYARVSPEDKLRIVQALQKRGHIVAMTGDGVNDSPALKKADIGVAMGITGTDVAKEAADAVLLDDNFATIVSAVEEGRVIYDNILRFIKYSIAGNLAKVLIMLLSPLIGITIALQPLQLLWLNLLTDGLMGLGLGLEPAEADTMNRPPRDPAGSLFGRGGARHIIWVGLLIMGLSMAVGYAYYSPHDRTWQTMIFTTVAFTQIGNAIGLRAIRKPGVAAWSSNPAMVVVVLSAVTLQAAAVYSPFLNRFFHVKPLAPADLGLCVILGLVVFVVVALEKRLSRAKGTARAG
ncbi:MAG TPA: cation-translocating P-type ATPase [Deltaproteobacteria bacterium]|nr:MAG: Calcium-transporting ATPase [Deltaproteobacteria bacterium ADurb.Bin072]HNQ86729.1 cation-translocating P-type ATPase [Deltaproteobacteria bacterium]HRW80720.1 cation-translocating P-type ATPase [Desulfomonilia bacterium]HNS90868.1 cation-translocating P-type ATPase [Deltaproteobacteria bacterium]HOA45587.1 cation-translocating P-type ATPase [Deltaproteobacteria bacterium]